MADPLDASVTEALRALRVQLSSGVDAAAALEMAASVCSDPDGRVAFLDASNASTKGEGFEKLVQCLRDITSDGERAVILTGFKAGRIEECLDAVVLQRELWHKARSEIRAGMIMPIAMLFIAALVAPLPGLFAEGGTMLGYFVSASIPLLIAYGFWRLGHRMMEVRKVHGAAAPSTMDNFLLGTPVIQRVEQRRNVSEFSSLLSLQLAAGVPITEALETCSRCLVNGFYRQDVARATLLVRKGQPLSQCIQAGKLWPPEFVSTVAVGEKSGMLDDQLMRYSNHAREAYTRAIKEFAAWMPRVVYGLVALFIIWNIIKLVVQVAGIYQQFL